MNDPIPSAPAPAESASSAVPPAPAAPVPCHPLAPPPPAGLAMNGDGRLRALDPAFIQAEAVAWWILLGVIAAVGAMGLAVTALLGGPGWIWLAALVAWLSALGLIALGAMRWPRLAWRHSGYVVQPKYIEIHHGVLWRSIVTVPCSRVQHIDVLQGPLLRRHGLATLAIHTAGTEATVVTLPGLRRETALHVRDFLLAGAQRDVV